MNSEEIQLKCNAMIQSINGNTQVLLNQVRFREDNDDVTLLVNYGAKNKLVLFINRTTKEVLSLAADGWRSISDITAAMSKKYPAVDEETLHQDVRRIIIQNIICANLKYKNTISSFFS